MNIEIIEGNNIEELYDKVNGFIKEKIDFSVFHIDIIKNINNYCAKISYIAR